jgi:hypothetical protein
MPALTTASTTRFVAASLAIAAMLAGCSSVSLDQPGYPPMAGQQTAPSFAPPPVVTVQPMPAQAMPVRPDDRLQAAPPPPVREPSVSAFTTRLDGRNEVPPVYSMGTGKVDAVLDQGTGLFRFIVNFSNLSSPVTAVQFHGPADVGGNAPPIISLPGAFTSPYEGRLTLTPAQSADLMAGRWYVNLRTAGSPAGELRGQLILQH